MYCKHKTYLGYFHLGILNEIQIDSQGRKPQSGGESGIPGFFIEPGDTLLFLVYKAG
jgi:hypothetical protein